MTRGSSELYPHRPDVNYFNIVDSVVWSFITAVETLALVAMLCFFFVLCGCTL
ncbi:hypothetical protein MKW94_017881 [Papaver nudicaule]|uniref:Uncharacterized protein n=1 Tax=Papaver nudicaule TaxID=74823 RepID=A0AA41V3B1_PAPNU|nr:hypothetical protein [Papaver nudicaule]